MSVTGRLIADTRFSDNMIPLRVNKEEAIGVGILRLRGELMTLDDRYASYVEPDLKSDKKTPFDISVGESRKLISEPEIDKTRQEKIAEATKEFMDKQTYPAKKRRGRPRKVS